MNFTSSQKAFIKAEFDKRETSLSKYQLVYKPISEYKVTWSITDSPTWDWDAFEYRLLVYLDSPVVKEEMDDIYVYHYHDMLYYNDPNNEVHMVYLTGKDLDGSLTTAASVIGDFTVTKDMYVGDDHTYDAVLKITCTTTLNTDNSMYSGPKIRFQKTESMAEGFVCLVYSDLQPREDNGMAQSGRPYLAISSRYENEIFNVNRKKVTSLTVSTKNVTDDLTATNAVIENLTAKINFTDINVVGNLFYPVGSYYWSSVKVNPSKYFGGTWEQVTDTFLYATSGCDGDVTTAKHGEAEHTITSNELGSHYHSFVGSHTHNVTIGEHSHSIRDTGHMHTIRTIGDDYNGSGRWIGDQRSTGNFVGDGHADMTVANWNRGIWANASPTGVTVANGKSNIIIDSARSNLSVNPYVGGSQPHNNMPPYIAAYCWLRVE